jgi:hypothetical protein
MMGSSKKFLLVLGALVGVGLCSSAGAQTVQVPSTVQLPSFDVFTVNTTVSVPDGGRMKLGGVGRSSSSAISRGVPGLAGAPGFGRLFRNHGIGSESSAANASVTTRILILSELEDELLAASLANDRVNAADGRPLPTDAVARKAEFLSRNMGNSTVRR